MLAGGSWAPGMARPELVRTPKGQLEKQVLAWWVDGRTVITPKILA